MQVAGEAHRVGPRVGSLKNRSAAIGYAHQTCPRCSHPAGADEGVCTRIAAAALAAVTVASLVLASQHPLADEIVELSIDDGA